MTWNKTQDTMPEFNKVVLLRYKIRDEEPVVKLGYFYKKNDSDKVGLCLSSHVEKNDGQWWADQGRKGPTIGEETIPFFDRWMELPEVED